MCFWILAMVGAYAGWKRKWKRFNLKWIIPFILFGVVLHALSYSLAAILYFLVVASFLVLYEIGKRWNWKIALAVFIPVIASVFLAVNYVPIVKGQWLNAKQYADRFVAAPETFVKDTNPWTGSEERLILWIVSTEILHEAPLGLGAKNYDDAIYKRLKAYGKHRMAAKHLNPHNQYLTTGIEIGVFGIVLLVIMVFYGIIYGLRRKHWLLLVTSSSLAFHCLFESMLERQSGIVFFCLMLGVFYMYPLERTPKKVSQ
jgi:O-antigen ligase